MGRKKSFSVTQVTRRPKMFRTEVPFDITMNGLVVATVIKPDGVKWRECEQCGENTQNIIQFQDDKLKWQTIILCDKCGSEHL